MGITNHGPLSILAGLVILYSISREKAREQRWEINLMKVLGASFKDLRNQVRFEFGLLCFCASILGVSLSTGQLCPFEIYF